MPAEALPVFPWLIYKISGKADYLVAGPRYCPKLVKDAETFMEVRRFSRIHDSARAGFSQVICRVIKAG